MFLFNSLHRMNVRLGLACDLVQLSESELSISVSDEEQTTSSGSWSPLTHITRTRYTPHISLQ